jgi:AAA+ ATPase superfamily predicted ATPase
VRLLTPEPDPLFVNRARELGEFDAVLARLRQGIRRHLSLLGLRRIGKTVLMDEVRRRHPTQAIAYLAVDEVVSSPDDFVRTFTAEVLGAVHTAIGRERLLGQTNENLLAAAAGLGPEVEAAVQALVESLRADPSSGALFIQTLRLPALVSASLDLPILIVLDELQEIVRLRRFPHTENLLGTIRAALDRPGKVAFVVAGSRVSALRALLTDRESPLFQRFEHLELGPFAPDATLELATRIWDEDGLTHEPDAVVRLHKLTGGWPFYVRAVAMRAAQMAHGADGRITPDTVDLAFLHEVIGRAHAIGLHCSYLLETAVRDEGEGLRNTVEAVLRTIAAHGTPVARQTVARRLRAHHEQARIYRAINHLIDTDFLHEEGGLLRLQDPVFAFWLVVEPERRHPDASLSNQQALRKRLAWYEAQHAQDRQEMGTLFEKRVENLVRQFRGQEGDGKLLGTEGTIRLPAVREAGTVRVDNPRGRHGARPDSYEVDIVTIGDGQDDCWAIEVKHRQGAITEAMVRRFVESARAVATERGLRFAHLWMVAPRGIRPEGLALARREGVLTSGMRDLVRLERMVASEFSAQVVPGY